VKRLGIAVVIVLGIYGIAVGTGSLLYATGTIATGPTHNDCGDLKQGIADREYHGDEEEVPQSQLKQETIDCLAGEGLYTEEGTHFLTEEEAFRSEWLFWSIWPGVICAVIFLLWPAWTRILLRQDEAEATEEAPRLEPGL
jgi:hypothetical protein